MGVKLMKFYEIAKGAGGMQATMRLAMKTGLPSTKAGEAPDSPENIQKFQEAIVEITGQAAPAV